MTTYITPSRLRSWLNHMQSRDNAAVQAASTDITGRVKSWPITDEEQRLIDERNRDGRHPIG